MDAQIYKGVGAYAHTMKGTLIAFTVPTGKDRVRASRFAKMFYGQETSSHEGRYRYWRCGLLDDIPYNKLIRGVVIVREEDADRTIGFLREHSAQVHVRVVELDAEDRRAMELSMDE
jgi:hypothetical protein